MEVISEEWRGEVMDALLFKKKKLKRNICPRIILLVAEPPLNYFKTYSYTFYFYSLNFPVDCPSSSPISYMDIDLKCWSVAQMICELNKHKI